MPPLTTSTTTTPVAAATPQTGLGKAVDAAKKAAGSPTPRPPSPPRRRPPAARRRPRLTSSPSPPPIAAIPAERARQASQGRRRRAQDAQGARARRARPRTPSRGARSPTTTATSATRSSASTATTARSSSSRSGSTSSRPTARSSTTSASRQSPSIVVIDRNLKGTVLTGYVDRVAINQVIADARRDSITPNITDAYLRKANTLCGRLRDAASSAGRSRRSPAARPPSPSQQRLLAIVTGYRREVQRLAAPAEVARLNKAWLKGLKADEAVLAACVKATQDQQDRDDLRRPTALYRRPTTGAALEPALQRGRPHRLRGEPHVVDSAVHGPRALHRTPRRAHGVRRRAFRGL